LRVAPGDLDQGGFFRLQGGKRRLAGEKQGGRKWGVQAPDQNHTIRRDHGAKMAAIDLPAELRLRTQPAATPVPAAGEPPDLEGGTAGENASQDLDGRIPLHRLEVLPHRCIALPGALFLGCRAIRGANRTAAVARSKIQLSEFFTAYGTEENRSSPSLLELFISIR